MKNTDQILKEIKESELNEFTVSYTCKIIKKKGKIIKHNWVGMARQSFLIRVLKGQIVYRTETVGLVTRTLISKRDFLNWLQKEISDTQL